MDLSLSSATSEANESCTVSARVRRGLIDNRDAVVSVGGMGRSLRRLSRDRVDGNIGAQALTVVSCSLGAGSAPLSSSSSEMAEGINVSLGKRSVYLESSRVSGVGKIS